MNILVTGGAGYIGSHTVRELLDKKYRVIVFDNLINGHRKFVPKKAVFINGDLGNKRKLDLIFKMYKVDAVIHFAAFTEVGESVKDPLKFYQNNVVNTLNLLSVMVKNDVKRIIYSSSAAVYGMPKKVPIKEDASLRPINPYGHTKVIIEKVLQSMGNAYGLRHISLRYFNAAGASLEGGIGEKHDPESHLIPLILQVALGKRDHIKIFGTDYPTRDGTCIRDYIHVSDLANAHVLGLEALNRGAISECYNLGNGKGYSVKEVIEMCKKVTQQDIPILKSERRPGDPPILVASSKKIKKELKWKPKYGDLKVIVQSAWDWHKNE